MHVRCLLVFDEQKILILTFSTCIVRGIDYRFNRFGNKGLRTFQRTLSDLHDLINSSQFMNSKLTTIITVLSKLNKIFLNERTKASKNVLEEARKYFHVLIKLTIILTALSIILYISDDFRTHTYDTFRGKSHRE